MTRPGLPPPSRPTLIQEQGLWAIGGNREGPLGIASEREGDATQSLRGAGYSWDVLLERDRAFASLGEFGIPSIALR